MFEGYWIVERRNGFWQASVREGNSSTGCELNGCLLKGFWKQKKCYSLKINYNVLQKFISSQSPKRNWVLIKQFVLNTRVRIRDPYHLTATPPTLLIDFVHSPRNGFVDVQEGLKNWYRNIFGLRSYFSIFFFFFRKTKNSIGKSCMSVHSGFRFFSQFFFLFPFFSRTQSTL